MMRVCSTGKREKGGIYLEVMSSPFGYPFYYFVPDPFYKFPEELKNHIKPQGINILELPNPNMNNVILDIVGSKHYPHFTDWLQESNILGISRRISKSDLYSLANIDIDNTYFVVLHRHTIIKDEYIDYVIKNFYLNLPEDFFQDNICHVKDILSDEIQDSKEYLYKDYSFIAQMLGKRFANICKKYEKVKDHVNHECIFKFSRIISETEFNLYKEHKFFDVEITEERDDMYLINIRSHNDYIHNNNVIVLKGVSDKELYDGYGAIFKIKANALKIAVINDPDEGKHEKAVNIIKGLGIDTKLEFELVDF